MFYAEGSLCLQDIENLKAWQFNVTQDKADLLSPQGRQDTYFLGRRIRSYFPELIDTTVYNPEKYVVSWKKKIKTSKEFLNMNAGFNYMACMTIPMAKEKLVI